jgi:hypothetical protein
MIVLYHDGFQVIDYEDLETNIILSCSETSTQKCVYSLFKEHINNLLIWCKNTIKNLTIIQLNGYKILPIYFNKQTLKNSFLYVKKFNQRCNISLLLAKK